MYSEGKVFGTATFEGLCESCLLRQSEKTWVYFGLYESSLHF